MVAHCSADRSFVRELAKQDHIVRSLGSDKYQENYCEGCPNSGGIVMNEHKEATITNPLGERPEITVRNLLYHVCPLKKNNDWLDNVQTLAQHLDIFNGRRVLAVVEDEARLLPKEEVTRVLNKLGEFDIIYMKNDIRLREVQTFRTLLGKVFNRNPHEATFYAHTKGNSTADGVVGARAWRDCMYHNLLGRWKEVMNALAGFSVVGTTKHDWGPHPIFPWPSRMKHGAWMFCGTFFWFRHDAVFTHRHWDSIPNDRYGAEAWLGGFIPSNEAFSIYQPWNPRSWKQVNPYLPKWYHSWVRKPEAKSTSSTFTLKTPNSVVGAK
jgi:hypothetical protein